ncbi:MAG: hypothetical protein RSD47_00815 [Romboutsia sp.]
MSGILKVSDLEYIKEVITTNTEFKDKYIDITVKCYMTYGVYEEFKIARIHNDYIVTYINGVEKEYKRRKAALNAILRVYNTMERFDDIMAFKVKEIEELNEIEVNEFKDNNIEIYNGHTVGNSFFSSYNKAYDYCIKSDFNPGIMLLKVNIHEELNQEIKILDNEIDRLINTRIKLKKEIDKNNIKYNDRKNSLIKKLTMLDNEMDMIEEKIMILIQCKRKKDRDIFYIQQKEYKKKYSEKKYKIIDKKKNIIFYVNDLKKYLYDFRYEIMVYIDGKEIIKQGKGKKYNLYYSIKEVNIIYTFKNNDTVYTTEKIEVYTDDNILIYKRIEKNKRNIRLVYSKFTYDQEYLLLINGISFFRNNKTNNEIDIIMRAKTIFKKDKEIMELLK